MHLWSCIFHGDIKYELTAICIQLLLVGILGMEHDNLSLYFVGGTKEKCDIMVVNNVLSVDKIHLRCYIQIMHTYNRI